MSDVQRATREPLRHAGPPRRHMRRDIMHARPDWFMELGPRVTGWMTAFNGPSDWRRYQAILRCTLGGKSFRKRGHVMSEYEQRLHESHIRTMSCERKTCYENRGRAFNASRDVWRWKRLALEPYKCQFCDGWHLTKMKQKPAPPSPPRRTT